MSSKKERDNFRMFRIKDYNMDNLEVLFKNYMDPVTGRKDMELAFINCKIFAKASVGINIFFWTMME